MRISVSGDKDLIDALDRALAAQGTAVERPAAQQDRTEQKFGLAEIATIVAILGGLASLAETLISVAKSLKPDERQSLKVKTALGMVTLDLSRDVGAAELQRQLAALDRAGG